MSSAEYRRDEALRDTAQAMSQENVEIVRSLFEASNRGDIRVGADLIDEGVVFDTRGMDLEDEDFARVYFGPGGVRAFWRAWLPAWTDMQVEVRWIRAVGDRVIVWLHQQQVGRVSGLPVEFDVAWDFLFRDGKIVRMAFFRDERKVLEAVGLSEQNVQVDS
jgi:ketosteroid isomerase-like protein